MAHDLFGECNAAGNMNISSLDSAIYLLQCAASSWPPADPQFPECLNYLATALLTRFTYTGNPEDVKYAIIMRGGAFGMCSLEEEYFTSLVRRVVFVISLN